MGATLHKPLAPNESDARIDAILSGLPWPAESNGKESCSTERPDFKLFTITPAECAMEPNRPYIVKGFIRQGDHVALIGQPGSGKSTLAPYLGYRVALGLSAFGHRTRKGAVLYLAAENAQGIKARVAALRETFGDSEQFYIQPKPVDLLNVFCVAQVEKLVQDLQPSLIVIDTLAAAFPGLSENDAAPMAKAVGTLRQIANWSDAATLTLHHPPKAAEASKGAPSTPRGSGILLADLDGLLNIEGRGAGVRHVRITKNRNGVPDISFAFTMQAHELGVDEDGDPVTAPIAVPHDAKRDPRHSLNSRQRAALEIIEGLLADSTVPLPDRDGFPACTIGIRSDDATEACAVESVSSSPRRPDRRIQARKIIEQLVTQGVVRSDQGYIWIESCEGAGGCEQ